VSVSVSLCVLFVCLSAIISSELHVQFSRNFLVHVTYGRASVLLWLRSDTLCTSGFVDDVIFARQAKVARRRRSAERSAHAALGLAINCAQ